MKERIKLHDKVFKPLIPGEEIEKSIDAVAAKIKMPTTKAPTPSPSFSAS